jgi:hypothetical protein
MNTLGTEVFRTKWRKASLETALRNGLVLEKICEVDRSGNKTIKSPYQTAPTTVIQAMAGTYTPAASTITNDTLTVAYEFIVSEHVFDFEDTLSNFDLFSARQDDMNYSVMAAIDKYGLNVMLADGTGTYTTPVGGFTTAANINVIISNLASKVMGYADSYKGMFLVVENTDVPGFMQAQMTNGFSYADAALNNGFMTTYGGVEVYVVRTGTFTDTDLGDMTAQNAGHRLFGVKNICTFAEPQGIKFEEKSVSGKTGKEIAVYGYCAVKVWAPKASLIVDITLA